MDRKIIGIGELNHYVAAILHEDYILNSIWLRAEISNLTYHKSGHLYFSLKDENAGIQAVMFSQYASQLNFQLVDGMKVLVRCQIGLYEKVGNYQAYVYEIEQEGLGTLYSQFLELKSTLEQKGYFDKHQPLAKYPAAVGIITSKTGAAILDIIRVGRRRNKTIPIYIYPASVQGQYAQNEIVWAIEKANADAIVDVIILGRGGGSIEDLWCFNELAVALAIYNSKIPIVCAVGHEIDFTISDFVADHRAATPSAAAEIVFPNLADTVATLKYHIRTLDNIMKTKVRECEVNLNDLINRPIFKDKTKMYLQKIQELDLLAEDLNERIQDILHQKKMELNLNLKQIEKLSPIATILRGFGMVTSSSGHVVSNVDKIAIGDDLDIRVANGNIISKVISKQKDIKEKVK